ncbi:flagellar protein FlaG [Thiomicrospira sp. R3]|uniref:flagellar protein FlaG n=1 Tax=Thiomicrospira sp. R3 TaxID=3035472 RepID=UPI00259B036B|nr:flagellar protein FlaG [Thiomicrospira sp. R3]WFE69799.1 flagellar protein FlaG [Thiomicrospira sp. R3]
MSSFSEGFSHLPSSDIISSQEKKPQLQNDIGSSDSVEVKSLASLLEKANEAFKLNGARLMFELDAESNRPVLFIKDAETLEVIRQVPSDSYLEMSKKITDYLERTSAVGLTQQSPSAIGMLASETA